MNKMLKLKVTAMLLCIAMVLSALPLFPAAEGATPLNRPADPVILSGADAIAFANALPENIVAFRYTGTAWEQIPVQIDERKVASYGTDVFNGVTGGYVSASHAAFTQTVYCDPTTFVGADTNPCVDADDEIVFMARDTGTKAPEGTPWPDGVKKIRSLEIAVNDPLDANSTGYAYLFERAVGSSLTSDAGKAYVSYEFKLASGQTYKEAYPFVKSKNAAQVGRPEDSTITTANYTYHFEDRWADDGLIITAGDATGVDILDRNKVSVMPSSEVPALAQMFLDYDMSGSRTEDTFDGFTNDPAEGAFICNINGPVRAIRAFIGANSGPMTQRDYYAYDSRLDTVTYLRVHAMPSLMSFMDYSPAASGMTYYRDDATGGVTVDGVRDSLSTTAAVSETELLTGAQGSLALTTVLEHNLSTEYLKFKAYYLDDAGATPKDTQHTGDAFAYGASGMWVCGDLTKMMTGLIGGGNMESVAGTYGIPNTDPVRSSSAKSLTVYKTMHFRAPGMTYAEAQTATEEKKNPLTYATRTIAGADAALVTWYATYNANGAKMGNVPVDYTEYYADSVLTLPGNTGGLVRTGYTFLGWSTDPMATEPMLTYTGDVNGETKTVTFYAVWQKATPYTETGTTFVEGTPASLFDETFDYTEGTTASGIVSGGKWHTRAEATTDGAFSKIVNGRFIFQGRTSKNSSSSPRIGVRLDSNLVAGGNTVTLTCKVRTGTVGKTKISLWNSSKSLISLVTLQNGAATANGSASQTVSYTPSSGTYTAQDGEAVDIKLVIDFGSKLYSAYANGQLLIEGGALSALGTETNLILMLDGSYSYNADGLNWGEYDDIVLRQAAVATQTPAFYAGTTKLERLQNGEIGFSYTIYNELPTAYTALAAVRVVNSENQMTQLKVLPLQLGARSKADLTTTLNIQSTDTSVQVCLLKDFNSLWNLTAPYMFTR